LHQVLGSRGVRAGASPRARGRRCARREASARREDEPASRGDLVDTNPRLEEDLLRCPPHERVERRHVPQQRHPRDRGPDRGDVDLVTEIPHLAVQLAHAGKQVRAGGVVVVDAKEPGKAVEDALQAGQGHPVEAARGQHPREVVEHQDAEGLAEPRELGAQESDHRVGEDLQSGLSGLWLRRRRLQEGRRAEHVRGDRQRPARRHEVDSVRLREASLLEELETPQDERHQAVRLRVGARQPRPLRGWQLQVPYRGRRVGPPHDAGPEGARLVGHSVLDPEAGEEDDVREAGEHLQVRREPGVGVEEEIERVHAGEPRHPGAVHDEGHRDPLRHATAGGGHEVLPVAGECHSEGLQLEGTHDTSGAGANGRPLGTGETEVPRGDIRSRCPR